VNIDPRSHIPLYLQIADGVRQAVAAGVYRPGETLPSLRVMALDAQVNPNTVQRAYDLLAREGLFTRGGARGCSSRSREPRPPKVRPSARYSVCSNRPFARAKPRA
jgi:DNA-binding transcriptional regulator YhcF (GntR family)